MQVTSIRYTQFDGFIFCVFLGGDFRMGKAKESTSGDWSVSLMKNYTSFKSE